MPANLPPSIFDAGVSGMGDPQSLRDRGYGVSLGEFAAHVRAQKRAAWLYCSLPVRSAAVFKITINKANPIVSWGNR